MWRHIPKIVVLSAIALMVLVFYVTRSATPPRASAPNVVYINQGVGTEKPPAPRP